MTETDALDKIFKSSPIPTIAIQVNASEFNIVVANDAYLFAERTEKVSAFIGQDFFEAHQHIAEPAGYTEVFHAVLTTKNAYQWHHAGRYINTYPILGENGEVAFIVQQLLIPEELPLIQGDQSLAAKPALDLFDFSPVPMWVYNVDSLRILAANKAALAEYGYELSEFLNFTVRILWPASEVPRMEHMVTTKVKKDLPNSATVRHIKKSGEIFWVDIHSAPLPSWGKNARIVTAIDISQKLKAESALKKNRDRFRSLLQTTNGIVWEADPVSHHFNYVSDYVEEVLGYASPEWLLEKEFWRKHIYHEDLEAVMKIRDSHLEVGKTYSVEYRMVNSTGNTVWVRDTFTPIFQGDKVALRGLMVDINVVKRAMAVDQLDKEILTKSAKEDNSFQEVLKNYVLGIEKLYPLISFGIMLVKDGKLSNLASPSVSKTIIAAAEGLSFNSSLEHGESEPVWESFGRIVSENGFTTFLRYPLHNNDGEISAVFFIYHNSVSGLHLDELNIAERTIALLRVILERRQYSKVLKETTIMMLQSQELARFGNWSWDVRNGTVTWSDTLYSIYGLSPDSLTPTFEAYLSIIHTEDRQHSYDIIQDLLKNGEDRAFEERMVRPGGEVRYVKTWAKVIYGESGFVEKMIGACLDITESKQVQNDLQTSKAELQKMLDRYLYVNKATNDVIFDWDIATDIIEWGESFTRLFGYSKFPVIYTLSQWFALVHPGDLEFMTSDLYNALADKDEHRWSAEYRIKKEKGEYAFVEEIGYLLRDESGKAIRVIGVIRNITERKETERNLQLSNEKYADLFHLSPLPLLVYDLESLQILDVNKAAIEHYEYSFEEFLSFTLRDIRPPDDVAILDVLMKKHVKAGHVHTGFTRHVKKSGKIILVYTKGNSINYKGRNARIVVAIDNSEKIKAEESLRQSERRFKTMIQEGSDLIVILVQTGNISYISPNIRRLFNLDPTDMMLTTPFKYIHKDDLPVIRKHLLSVKKDETIKVSPYRVILKGGEIRWLETTITNKMGDPAIAGIIANSRDITSRMKTMLKNKELLDRYNAVSKATSDTIWDSNIVTRKIIWNHSITEIFGYEETQTSIEWWREHVHPDDVARVTNLIETQLNLKETKWVSEYRFRCADGAYKTVLDRGFIIFSDEGNPIRMIGCMQDITERVAYVHAIENHNKKLSEIAWMQSHLVRAPLARILGITEILAERENSQEEIDEMLSYLSVSAAELDCIIKDIIGKSQNL